MNNDQASTRENTPKSPTEENKPLPTNERKIELLVDDMPSPLTPVISESEDKPVRK
jgi:hypothetical protein